MQSSLQGRKDPPSFAQKMTTWLSCATAGAFTFIATGPVFQNTKGYVEDYVFFTYSDKLVGISTVLYFGLIALTMFCLASLVIQTLVEIVRSKTYLKSFR